MTEEQLKALIIPANEQIERLNAILSAQYRVTELIEDLISSHCALAMNAEAKKVEASIGTGGLNETKTRS